MPQVPRYSPQVEQRGLPNARVRVQVDPETLGGGIGQSIANIGLDVYAEEQRKADEILLMSARRRLTEKSNAALYDPKTGALTKKGRDAFDLPNTVIPDFDASASEINNELNERQRRAFAPVIEQTRAGLDLAVQRHVFQERQKFDTEETTAFVTTERDRAVLNYKEPPMVAAALANQIDAINKYAARNGIGPEIAKKMVTEAQSRTHLAVIERAIASGDDRYAKAYYEEVKADIVTGDESVKAAKLVEAATYQGESQRTADKILLGLSGPAGRSLAQEEIKKIEDPKLRDLVQQRVDQHFTRQEIIQRDIRESNFLSAQQMVLQGIQVPADLRNSLSLAQVNALDEFTRKQSKGQDPETDWGLYYRLMGNAASDDPKEFDKFLKMDLMQYRSNLADVEFKQLVTLQKSLRNKDTTAEDKLNGYRTIKQIVDDSLNAVGIDATPKDGTSDAKDVARFRRMVDDMVLDFKRTNKRDPNTTETQEMVDRLLIKQKIPGTGWFWNDNKRVFQITIDDVPQAEREEITKALIRNGKRVTDDEITRLYGQRLNLQNQAKK